MICEYFSFLRIPDPGYRMLEIFFGSRIPDIGSWKFFSDPGSRISDLEIFFRIPDPGYRILKFFFGSRIPDIEYCKNFSNPGSRISDIENFFRIPDPGYRILQRYFESRIPDIGYWKYFSDPGSRMSDPHQCSDPDPVSNPTIRPNLVHSGFVTNPRIRSSLLIFPLIFGWFWQFYVVFGPLRTAISCSDA